MKTLRDVKVEARNAKEQSREESGNSRRVFKRGERFRLSEEKA